LTTSIILYDAGMSFLHGARITRNSKISINIIRVRFGEFSRGWVAARRPCIGTKSVISLPLIRGENAAAAAASLSVYERGHVGFVRA
jgi:hypothetical protein